MGVVVMILIINNGGISGNNYDGTVHVCNI